MGRGHPEALIGERFGRLIVIGIVRRTPSGTYWLCKCDCGGDPVERLTSQLKATKENGCPACEYERRGHRKTHGEAYGLNKTRLYSIWKGMKKRCSNANDWIYPYYGGKGIIVCEEWQQYPRFKEWALAVGYADNLTIDRLDPNGNYEPSNCEWVTKAENSRRMNLYHRQRRTGKFSR